MMRPHPNLTEPAPRRNAHPRRHHAFTLVEMIATMVIIGTLGSIASTIIYQAARTYTSAVLSAQLNAELSAALDRIDRTLRQIPLKSTTPTAPDIASLAANSITYGTNSVLSYNSATGQVTLAESGGTAALLLQNVTSFSIAAFDESNAALAASLSGSACDPVRRITVTVTVSRDGSTQTLRTKSFIRSLMAGASP